MPRILTLGLSRSGHSHKFSAADFWIAVLLVAATIVWSTLSGKDLNWDQLNYHFYAGFSLLNDRIGQDFMAANAQSYLNPLAYVPFYWMVAQGWHSLLIASLLATFHGLAIVFAFVIARTALENEPLGRVFASLGAVLAFLSPIFLTEAGTSFADITTAVLLLAAVLCLLRANLDRRWWMNGILLAGALAGAAGGLKLSNLVFSPAFVIMLIVMYPSPRSSVRGMLLLGTGAVLGLCISHGYWSWQLVNEFAISGSPTLSSLIGSAEVPQSADLFPRRFLPNSLLEAATLPFRMVGVRSWIYLETVAPDLRFAAVMTGAIGGACLWLYRAKVSTCVPMSSQVRKQLALFAFFATTLVLWISTSSNGRYGILVSILCGPILALLANALSRRKDVAISLLLILTTLQLLHVRNGQLRWVGEEWTPSWYQVSIPERLQENPSLYLSLGGNSNSYIAPFLPVQSAFVNPIGQVSIELDGTGGKRLQKLLEKYRGRTRVIARADALNKEDKDLFAYWVRRADVAVARLGLAVDINDCLLISAAGTTSPRHRDGHSDAETRDYLQTCALVERPYEHASERNRIRNLVQDIAAWCPKLFGTPLGVVEQMPDAWSAVFSSTDNTLIVQSGRILLSPKQAMTDLNLGTIEEWEQGERPNCAKMPANLRKAYTF